MNGETRSAGRASGAKGGGIHFRRPQMETGIPARRLRRVGRTVQMSLYDVTWGRLPGDPSNRLI